MTTDDNNPAAMPGHKINAHAHVRDLRARLAAAEAERDALLKHCVRPGGFMGMWGAMIYPNMHGHEYGLFDTESAAHAAVRKAAGLGEQGEV